jgi:hypothetical protein
VTRLVLGELGERDLLSEERTVRLHAGNTLSGVNLPELHSLFGSRVHAPTQVGAQFLVRHCRTSAIFIPLCNGQIACTAL